MDDRDAMPPVLVYSSWRPPEVTVRRQVWFAVAGMVIGGLAGLVLLFVAVAAGRRRTWHIWGGEAVLPVFDGADRND